MFGQSGYSRAISADIGEIERRLRALERRLERVGSRTSAGAAQAADRVAETVAAALGSMAERFRDRAGATDEISRMTHGLLPRSLSPLVALTLR